jgi:phosphotransferase system HPr (HPr) family protein
LNHQIKVTVENEYGLHARPAAMIVRAVGEYESEVLLRTESEEANCRNILDLMSLAAACGQELDVQASGPDSEDAINRIKDLFESKFGG